jgi:hypothetical protein
MTVNILEYRLTDETAIFYYDQLSLTEIEIRKRCDFFIKDKVVYTIEDLYAEPGFDIIYVAPDEEEVSYSTERKEGLDTAVELREFKGEEIIFHPIVAEFNMASMEEVLVFIQKESVENGGIRYTRSSLELDEDRNTLVYYGVKG